MPGSGGKTQLTINRIEVPKTGPMTVDRANSFTAMLNPSEFKQKREIRYNTRPTLGQAASDTRFSAIQADTINLSLLLDGTGVVPVSGDNVGKSVNDHIKTLTDVVYKYDGAEHEPDHVRLLWGTLIFYGRLQSISIQYTLFKPSGDPLRAKVDLEFVGFMTVQEAALAANRSSPDLSHRVEVRAGDTLPLLCNRIYGDPAYYPEVARHNRLDSFRDLKPGDWLHFPPLE